MGAGHHRRAVCAYRAAGIGFPEKITEEIFPADITDVAEIKKH